MSAVQSIEKCDYILVTHSHFDHLLDVPPIVIKTGAMSPALSTPGGCCSHSVFLADLIQTVHPGDTSALEEYDVRVFPSNTHGYPGSPRDNSPDPQVRLSRHGITAWISAAATISRREA